MGWWQASDGNWYPPTQVPAGSTPGYPAAGQYPFAAAPQSHGLAVASLVLGILWLCGVGSILALIFGYRARDQMDKAPGRYTGRGLATAGVVLGWVGVGIIALLMITGAVSDNNDFGGINSDPSNGYCDYDRFIEDPDC
jgi:hypothetical protein